MTAMCEYASKVAATEDVVSLSLSLPLFLSFDLCNHERIHLRCHYTGLSLHVVSNNVLG